MSHPSSHGYSESLGEVDEEPQFYVRARRNYQPTRQGGLAFKKDDILAVFKIDSSVWLASIHGNNYRGTIPSGKIKYLDTLSAKEVEDLIGVQRRDDENSDEDDDEDKATTQEAYQNSQSEASTRADVGPADTGDLNSATCVAAEQPDNKDRFKEVESDPIGVLYMKKDDLRLSGKPFDTDQLFGVHRVHGKVLLRRFITEYDPFRLSVSKDSESSAHTVDEIRRLSHQYLLPFIGVCCIDSSCFTVFPCTNNGTLPDYVQAHPLEDRPRLLYEVADALAYLHKIGVIHGYIEGKSILVSDDGHAQLLVPEPRDAREDAYKHSRSLRWQSPELITGSVATAASDTYAFGITMAEILSGMIPYAQFESFSSLVVAVCIQNMRPDPMPESSPVGESYARVWQVAIKCWSREPRDRPPMREVATMLTPVEIVPNDVADVKPLRVGGFFGDVFVGTHKTYGQVALKRLRADDGTLNMQRNMQTFLREVEMWRRLQHEYILPLYGTCQIDGHPCMISPYMDNGTLRRYVKDHPDADRIRLLYETAQAIGWLHNRGLIHGHIKGTNILVSSTVHALLCDFGLSKLASFDTEPSLKGAGSCRWQSPELLEGSSDKTTKSDGWAFGMTIAEILTGGIPFSYYRAESQVILVVMIRNERPKMQPLFGPSGIPYYSAWRAAGLCWFKSPAERKSIPEILHLLKPIESSGDAVACPDEEVSSLDDKIHGGRCYCGGSRVGGMIRCKSADCVRQWFHVGCVGPDQPLEDWLCLECEFATGQKA